MVLGLGNPGETYRRTRHNAGFWVVEYLCETLNLRLKRPSLKPFQIGRGMVGQDTLFLSKPLTYMNRSGEVILPLLHYTNLPLDSLLVVCDTLDLPVGTERLRRMGSSAGHNGLKSIIASIGSGNFMRLYMGIGRPDDPIPVADYVLHVPRQEEQILMEESVVRAGKAILTVIEKGPEAVMNEINRKR